jgi:hypothetical protein
MPIVRPMVRKNTVISDEFMPGDLMATAGTPNTLATIGAGVWTGPLIAGGIITRTGPIAGFTDTTDTADNIIQALLGNAPDVESVQGTAFELLVQNTVAFAHTFAAGVGVVAGAGGTNLLNMPLSSVRDYLVTIVNSTRQAVMNCTFLNASAIVSFVLPPGVFAFPIGPDPRSVKITPGMTVSGTGITAGTTVIGVTQGQGGLIGVRLSGNTTAPSAAGGNVLTFSPTIRFDSLWGATL